METKKTTPAPQWVPGLLKKTNCKPQADLGATALRHAQALRTAQEQCRTSEERTKRAAEGSGTAETVPLTKESSQYGMRLPKVSKLVVVPVALVASMADAVRPVAFAESACFRLLSIS